VRRRQGRAMEQPLSSWVRWSPPLLWSQDYVSFWPFGGSARIRRRCSRFFMLSWSGWSRLYQARARIPRAAWGLLSYPDNGRGGGSIGLARWPACFWHLFVAASWLSASRWQSCIILRATVMAYSERAINEFIIILVTLFL